VDKIVDKITTLGKSLRKRPTDAGQLLWTRLKMKQMEGFKFRRQQPIDNYIVDFVCLHPPLNPLPSREGKLKGGASHQGRGTYPLEMRKNLYYKP